MLIELLASSHITVTHCSPNILAMTAILFHHHMCSIYHCVRFMLKAVDCAQVAQQRIYVIYPEFGCYMSGELYGTYPKGHSTNQ